MSISHRRDQVRYRGRERSRRAKTFKSEAAAKKWAEAKKLAKYKIVKMNLGLSKKYKISVS